MCSPVPKVEVVVGQGPTESLKHHDAYVQALSVCLGDECAEAVEVLLIELIEIGPAITLPDPNPDIAPIVLPRPHPDEIQSPVSTKPQVIQPFLQIPVDHPGMR